MCVGILHEVSLLKKVDFPALLEDIFQNSSFRVDETLIPANMEGRIQEGLAGAVAIPKVSFCMRGVTISNINCRFT